MCKKSNKTKFFGEKLSLNSKANLCENDCTNSHEQNTIKSTNSFKLLFLLVLTLIAYTTSFAQTDLVRWNATTAPTPQVSNMTANQIILGGGVTMSNAGYSGFRINDLHNGSSSAINYSKYLEFRIAPNSGYKIALSQFKLVYNSPNSIDGPTKLQVRYSTDPSFPSNGTLLATEQTLTRGSNQNLSLNFPANFEISQTIYIRLYAYGASNLYYTDFYLRNTLYTGGTYQGPTLTGSVSAAAPVTSNDNATTAENIAINIDILDNDSYSTLSAITITQQPTNGQNITVNGLTDVTYTPNNNYLGSDSFKYTITDQTGTSNEATVNITVSAPTPPTAVADSFSVSPGQTTNLSVLTNDTQGSGAFDYVTIITNATNGTAVANANNTVAYTPNTGFTGTDSFQYNTTNIHGLTSNTVTVTIDVTCGCTHTISGGSITVNSGETYCLTSGTWSGGVAMNGGTICISPGATFSTSYTIGGDFSGTVINRGTVSAFPLYSNNPSHTVDIINTGTFTTSALQDFAGSINNSGTFTISSNSKLLAGAEIINRGTMNLNNTIANNVSLMNYDVLTANGGFLFTGANTFIENRSTGTMSINMTSGSTNIEGQFDNSGTAQIKNANSGSGVSAVVNNYKTMQYYNNVIFGLNTYLTNDDVLEFHNIPSVEFQGPLLLNNNLLTIFDGGDLSLNSSITEMVNNKKVDVDGTISHNVAGSKIINNCTILSYDYFVGNGTSENNGLIWVDTSFELEGTSSILINSATGFIRGASFRNSGEISGYGSFYFTGNTDFESAGTFIGDDANSPIQFFDATSTGGNIFDVSVPSNPAVNVIRPASMTPLDESTYNCTAPPTTAGYPPQTEEVEIALCAPASVTFDLDDYVDPHPDVNGNSFTLLYTSIRLFDFNDAANNTNNSTSLTIPNKGTLTANTSTGVISFVPNAAFTSGSFEAEYRISNQWSGNPSIMPSARTKITISLINLPEAVDDSASTIENIAINIDVLDNDVMGDNPFSITGVIQPTNGSVTINNNGTPANNSDDTIDYTPNTNFFGEDTFTYTISDGVCGNETATVTITVTEADTSDFEAAMLTQIYHFDTTNNTDRWIEVTNIHLSNTIPQNKLYLALFKDKTGDQTGETPTATLLIGSSIAPGASVLIKKTGSSFSNTIGTVITNDAITDFDDANDILIITKATDATAWENRFDVVTNIANNTSLVRIDEALAPNATYTANEWVEFVDPALNPYRVLESGGPERHPHDPLTSEITVTNSNSNTQLGLHRINPTTRIGSAWSNGFPDRSRHVKINENYNHIGSHLKARKLVVDNDSKLAITNNLLVVTNDITLTGADDEIRLIGTSQLVQTHTTTEQISGTGKLLIDRTSTVPSKYRYNYMSSPVNTIGESTYTIETVLKDGTNPLDDTTEIGETKTSVAKDITFVGGYDGSYYDEDENDDNDDDLLPISLASYWIYTYAPGSNGRANWSQKGNDGEIPQTDGFIFKGPGRIQNYTFVGTPKDGNLTTIEEIGADENYLIGNPFASAINTNKFIEDNINSISGTLYFWEHQASANGETDINGHGFGGYVGGYATRNRSMGLAANSTQNNSNANNGTAGIGQGTYKEPKAYIAIGQGFFVGGDGDDGGPIVFNNSQREFITEGANSTFFKQGDKSKKTANIVDANALPIIKLGMDYKNEEQLKIHRQIGISFQETNSFAYDKGYDSTIYDLGKTDMYWEFENDDNKYIITGVQAISDELKVPLTIAIAESQQVSISIDEWQNVNKDVYINDLLTASSQKINNNNKAVFDLVAGTYKDRFFLTFKASENLSTGTFESQNVIVGYDNSQKLILLTCPNDLELTQVSLVNLNGIEVSNWKESLKHKSNHALNVAEINKGVYILKIQSNKGILTKKFIIH